jgi:arylsulfatase A-like enzyme
MTMDVLPTLCAIAEVNAPEGIDGKSLASVWLHGSPGDPNRTMVWVRREGSLASSTTAGLA